MTPDQTITLHIVQGLHQAVPGCPLSAFACDTSAHAEAASLLNIMLKDAGMKADATRTNWETRLKALKRHHPEADVWITSTPLKD